MKCKRHRELQEHQKGLYGGDKTDLLACVSGPGKWGAWDKFWLSACTAGNKWYCSWGWRRLGGGRCTKTSELIPLKEANKYSLLDLLNQKRLVNIQLEVKLMGSWVHCMSTGWRSRSDNEYSKIRATIWEKEKRNQWLKQTNKQTKKPQN